jgi:hypothetical protein
MLPPVVATPPAAEVAEPLSPELLPAETPQGISHPSFAVMDKSPEANSPESELSSQ